MQFMAILQSPAAPQKTALSTSPSCLSNLPQADARHPLTSCHTILAECRDSYSLYDI